MTIFFLVSALFCAMGYQHQVKVYSFPPQCKAKFCILTNSTIFVTWSIATISYRDSSSVSWYISNRANRKM